MSNHITQDAPYQGCSSPTFSSQKSFHVVEYDDSFINNLGRFSVVPQTWVASGGRSVLSLSPSPDWVGSAKDRPTTPEWSGFLDLDPNQVAVEVQSAEVSEDQVAAQPQPADRRSDALSLGNLTPNLSDPLGTVFNLDQGQGTQTRQQKRQEARAKRKAATRAVKARRAGWRCWPRLKTIDLPVPDDGATPAQRRDFIYRLWRHFQNQGYVGERACTCSRRGLSRDVTVDLVSYRSKDGRSGRKAKYGGLWRCGVVNECVFCGRRKAMETVMQISKAAVNHLEAGKPLLFLTLTIPHMKHDSPEDLVGLLKAAWTAINGGRRTWLSDSVSWWIRALELTFGSRGPHPHIHVMVALDEHWPGLVRHADGSPDFVSQRLLPQVERHPDLSVAEWDLSDLAVWWTGLVTEWCRQVMRLAPKYLGREVVCLASSQDLRSVPCASALPQYLAKAGLGAAFELGYSQLKQGRTSGSRSVFQLMYDLATEGYSEDLRLWRSYLAAVGKGAIITHSNGERNPFELYGDAPDVDLGALSEGSDWTFEPPELGFFLKEQLYRGLVDMCLDLEFLHHVEVFGPGLVGALVAEAEAFGAGLLPWEQDWKCVAVDLCAQLRDLVGALGGGGVRDGP